MVWDMSSGLVLLAACSLAASGGGAAALRPDAEILFLDLGSPVDEAVDGGVRSKEHLENVSNQSVGSKEDGGLISELRREYKKSWDHMAEQLGIDESTAVLVTTANWRVFAASVLIVFCLAVLNSCIKTLFPGETKHFVGEVAGWVKSVVLVVLLFCNTMVCFEAAYGSQLGDLGSAPSPFVEFCRHIHSYWTGCLVAAAITWVVCSYVHEVCMVKRAPLQVGEIFTANDVYTNATEGMFSVTVRFLLQSCLLLILVFVAEQGWRSPPKDVPLFRKVWNFILALTLQLYMVGQNKWRYAWQDMRRLRPVCAVQEVSTEGCGTSEAPPVIQFTRGDYFVRVAMSIVANGVFHKFVLLSYPIFIFGYIGNADMLSIVKDILAITIVQEIDNLANPVSFRAIDVR